MLLGEYAEVVDALHPNTTGQDNEAQSQRMVCITERVPVEEDGQLADLPSMRERSKCLNPTVQQLKQHCESLAKKREAVLRTRSDAVTTNPHKLSVCDPLKDNADHLYDSVNTLATTHSMPEEGKVVGAQENLGPKVPPVYHVLEGPTPKQPVTAAVVEQETLTHSMNSPAAPPKPPRSRQRLSCVSLDRTGTGMKSIDKQLSSVMAIYEEVPDRERSNTSLLLPPHVVREARGGATPQDTAKDHVYHVLEELPSSQNTPEFAEPEKQHAKKTVKANTANVSQACRRENAQQFVVYKTKASNFQSELPKSPQPISQEMVGENKCPKHRQPKKVTNSHSSAEPCTNTVLAPQCQLFDDPAYCTHSYGGSQKLASSTDSAISSPQFDEPSYATPFVKQGGNSSQSSDSLFDDPKYNSRGFTAERSTVGSLRAKFDCPKHYPIHGRIILHRRLLEGERRKVRHSSSVEHFGPSVYSSTDDLMDGSESKLRGNSMTDLTHQSGNRVHKLKVTHL